MTHVAWKTQNPENDLRTVLREAGFKATPARLKLLTILQKAKEPLAIQTIMRRVGQSMDQTTVYRTLNALNKSGLVRQIDFQHGHAHYELTHESADHHHIVCINCERVEDFTGCEIEKISKKVLKKSPQFNAVKAHALELFGICKSCDNKLTAKK